MNQYKCLSENILTNMSFSIVPIRYEDRFLIMKWRNEQIYHLRQSKPLTKEDQENYFTNIIPKLFEQENPGQILFSYLENSKCIGYGGLVHINWPDKNAEISFIMDSSLENKEFHKHWANFLELIENVAFRELELHKIFTYAFDLRPHLYETIEAKGYIREAELIDHCYFGREFRKVVIHSKIKWNIKLRKITKDDKMLVFDWANDELTRKNSFNVDPIDFDVHSRWFDDKIEKNAQYFIGEVDNRAIGLVRFDEVGSEAVIGILIDENFRGKGMSSEFLVNACFSYQQNGEKLIVAKIRKSNVASIKAFNKAGFKYDSDFCIDDIESVKYKFIK